MFSKPGVRRAELNNEMLRYRYAVSNTGSSARGLKFSEIYEKKSKCFVSKLVNLQMTYMSFWIMFYFI